MPVPMSRWKANPGILERYRKFLPIGPKTPRLTLLEGATPLLPAPRLSRRLGLPESAVFLKCEGLNPTGSFKDRGMVLAVSKAVERGARGIVCASTGNTAASAAAYAARAGIRCVVLLPQGGVAAGKLAQALMHGAEVLAVRGNFDQALSLVSRGAGELGLTVVNSINPDRIEGQKTAAFEIVEASGLAPHFQFMPVGNAGNIVAYWRGYTELHAKFRTGRPRMAGWQASGADPIVRGRPIASPKTIASAIRIGNPASWRGALRARSESRGLIGRVTDREILSAYRLLAELEGVFCEPSSAAGVAGLVRQARLGLFSRAGRSLRVVCILTGNGLKDPETPLKLAGSWRTIAPTLHALRRALR